MLFRKYLHSLSTLYNSTPEFFSPHYNLVAIGQLLPSLSLPPTLISTVVLSFVGVKVLDAIDEWDDTALDSLCPAYHDSIHCFHVLDMTVFHSFLKWSVVCVCSMFSLSLPYNGHSGGFHPWLLWNIAVIRMRASPSSMLISFGANFELAVMFYHFPYCKNFS